MDGLPGMKRGLQALKSNKDVIPIKKMVGPLAPKNGTIHVDGFTLQQVIVIFIVAFIAGIMSVTLSPAALRNALALLSDEESKPQVWIPKSLEMGNLTSVFSR